MALEESGTKFTERIEVNEDKEVEVFRVPAHNNVEGADFYHDFKKVNFDGCIQSLLSCLVKFIIRLVELLKIGNPSLKFCFEPVSCMVPKPCLKN